MRIPQVLDLNTQEAYSPSKVSLHLIEEQERKIHPEDFSWDNNFIPTMAFMCLRILADNFKKRPILYELEKRDQDHIQEMISTDLDIHLVVPLIESEQYWKRRYQAHYSLVPYQPHFGWTWKCLYLEQYLRNLLEFAEPQYKDENSFYATLNLCSSYIHTLCITQLQHWKPPKTNLPKENPPLHPVHHISFIPILKYLPYLVQLEICYGMNEVGMDYDPHMFKLAVEDCDRLGEAILGLKHLKVLRLHKSEIGCKHVQALVRKIMRNKSLIEINLSYCNIGNLGAKCLGMLLNVHEKLEVLRLKNNQIDGEGILGIAWALLLPEGAHLQVLDVAMNPLGDAGIRNLMRALSRGCLPRDLSIACCKTGEETPLFLGVMLNVNNSLRRLDLSGNNIGKNGGQYILECLQSNYQMVEIEMRDTRIPEDTQKEIMSVLKRNYNSNPPVDNKISMNMLFVDILHKIENEKEPNKETKKYETPVTVAGKESEFSTNNYCPNNQKGSPVTSLRGSTTSDAITLRKYKYL